MRRVWTLFGLDKPKHGSYGKTIYTYKIEDVEVLGRVVVGGEPKSPWACIHPEAWDDLPSNIEFHIDGVYTQRKCEACAF